MFLPIESYPEAFRRILRERGITSAQFAADVFPFWEAGQSAAIDSASAYAEPNIKPGLPDRGELAAQIFVKHFDLRGPHSAQAVAEISVTAAGTLLSALL